MCFEAEPSSVLGRIVRNIKIGPAPAAVNHRASTEFSCRGRDAKRALAFNPLHSRFLTRSYTRFFGGVPKRVVEIVTRDADRSRIQGNVQGMLIDKKP